MRGRRPSRLFAGVALLAVVALALPASASAHHLVATASIDGELGAVTKSGMRKLSVSWNAGCGDPNATVLVTIARIVKPKDPRRRPVGLDGAEAEEQGAGTAEIMVSSGARFTPTIEVACSLAEEDGTSHPTVTASADGPELYAPPRLVSYEVVRSSSCGDAALDERAQKKLQAGEQTIIEPSAAYNSLSMLRRPRSSRGIRLRIKGAGLNASRKMASMRNFAAFVLPKPKRAGKVRIWLTFDGTPTNKLTIRVLSRRGC